MALLVSRAELAAGDLGIEIERVGSHALLILAGEVDLSTVGELYEELAELSGAGVCHVALNFAEVTFMDASGLSLLVAEHKRAESMKGELIIFSVSHQVRRLFQITGLESYLNIRPRRT